MRQAQASRHGLCLGIPTLFGSACLAIHGVASLGAALRLSHVALSHVLHHQRKPSARRRPTFQAALSA